MKLKHIEINKADVAASFQKSVVNILVHKSIEAARQMGMDKLVLAGGVAANSSLEEHLRQSAKENNLEFYYPSKILCTDNAAMIACRGYYQALTGQFADSSLNAVPYLELTDRE